MKPQLDPGAQFVLDTNDELCRRLAKRSGWLLGSLDYRRAPEYVIPFNAGGCRPRFPD